MIRFRNPEIGRDPDTGGQVKYLVELMDVLSRHEKIRKVDLFTRMIDDKRTSPTYAKPVENIHEKGRIVRIRCGGKIYRKKVTLWSYLDEFVDNVIAFLKEEEDVPDVTHGHYADGNYIAFEISKMFGIPFISTGHSLGRNKKMRLLDQGMPEKEIDKRFNMERRIQVEEEVIGRADMVITSTKNEIDNQYAMYDSSKKANFKVIPPGINTDIFYPFYRASTPGFEMTIEQEQTLYQVNHEIERFLYDPKKPLILSIGRADPRKNFETIIQAFGSDEELQTIANLAIFAGIRKDITQMPDDEREILTNLLLLLDKYDLYGKLALPKKNDPKLEIPEIYRIAARKGGVFINATSGENFGLTLLEAGASGLPVVAAPNGGPKEIIEKCGNGLTVDVESPEAMANALKKIISSAEKWREYSNKGIQGVSKYYSWQAHVKKYMAYIQDILGQTSQHPEESDLKSTIGLRFSKSQYVLISDIDGTLIGQDDNEGFAELMDWLNMNKDHVVFGLATGRNKVLTQQVLQEHDLAKPDVLICSAGSEIYYTEKFIPDKGWESHISFQWDRKKLQDVLRKIPKLSLQEEEAQYAYKLSYYVDDDFTEDDKADIYDLLDKHNLKANLLFTDSRFMDFLPFRAGKGLAIRYISRKWKIPLDQILTAGNSGNDMDMLLGNMKGIVVGNYSPELEEVRHNKNVYFAEQPLSKGILEGIGHYRIGKDWKTAQVK